MSNLLFQIIEFQLFNLYYDIHKGTHCYYAVFKILKIKTLIFFNLLKTLVLCTFRLFRSISVIGVKPCFCLG
jgi:hypothetical protein